MLLERRELLENEFQRTLTNAAAEYLKIVVSGSNAEQQYKYSALKDKITSIESDLRIVNELIRLGHQ